MLETPIDPVLGGVRPPRRAYQIRCTCVRERAKRGDLSAAATRGLKEVEITARAPEARQPLITMEPSLVAGWFTGQCPKCKKQVSEKEKF